MDRFIEQAINTFHPTIKFTAEISENEITFLDTVVFKGEWSERFIEKFILDISFEHRLVMFMLLFDQFYRLEREEEFWIIMIVLYFQILKSQNYILFKISALGLFLKYS